MGNKLPKIFKGKEPKNVNQNTMVINKDEKDYDININKEINSIFSSDNYLYKADTIITLNNGDKIKKTIIGKTNNSLITLDDELIDVRNIVKIELV